MINKVRNVSVLLNLITLLSYAQNPSASFVTNKKTGCPPLSIQFTNTSVNATSYHWDLGNGNVSVLKNPSNVYSNPGIYTVKLIAVSANGQKDSVVSTNLITVEPNPTSYFHTIDSVTWTGGPVSFVNTSLNATSYLWDFGDGNTSRLKDVNHSYSSDGNYTVKLISYNTNGCADLKIMTNYIHVTPRVSTSFAVNTTNACDLSQVFNFTSTTPSANSWFWNFGDGNTSTLQNPQHIYNTAGIYTVALKTGSRNAGVDSVIKNNYISVSTAQTPIFASNTTTPCLGAPISFTNSDINTKGWLWDFGDNETSTQQNPTHIYQVAGNYDIRLTITTLNNCQYTTTINDLVKVQNNSVSNFTLNNKTGCAPLNVQFNNLSINDSAQLWEFGDGTTSTLKNPSYTYTEEGEYSVTLRSFNPSGCTSIFTMSNAVTIVPPIANFNADTRVNCAPMKVNFTNTSTNSSQWIWNFGDGTTSNTQNPVHTYTTPGTYDVRLIASDAQGCSDTLILQSYIQVNSNIPDYTPPSLTTGCVPLNTTFEMDMPGAVSWQWDFGDGTNSALQKPAHVYTTSGLFTVSLTVQLNTGCSLFYSNFKTFDVQGGLAEFTFTQSQCPLYIVNFKDSTFGSPVSWSWDFGDGSHSSLKDPIHTYANPGFYTVVFDVKTSAGCSSKIIQSNLIYFDKCGAGGTGLDSAAILPGIGTTVNGIRPSITTARGLSYVNGINGCIPLTVNFHNVLPGTTSWSWNFGDGTTSVQQHPLHTFDKDGTYNITMTAKDNTGKTETVLYSNYIHASGILTNFGFTQSSDCINTTLVFKDSSQNAVSWLWDFNDGSTDTIQNPTHTYGAGKNYNIKLTTTNAYGCSGSMSSNFTTVIETPILTVDKYLACGNQTLYFDCLSINSGSYLWNFGDGTTSTLKNPTHQFLTEGAFLVTLKLSAQNGCTRNFSLSDTIIVENPIADFTSQLKSGCNSTSVNFLNASKGAISPLSSHSKWDFGDGSPIQFTGDTIHTFAKPGTYNVKLVVNTDKRCNNSITKAISVYPTVIADFSSIQNTGCFPITVTYTDSSTKAVAWLWEFGDGSTSTLQNPTHTFTTLPDSTVKLTITDTIGCQASSIKPNIKLFKTDFSVSASSGCAPLKVDFTDLSLNAAYWKWDFGDGTVSTIKDPSHFYMNTGIYRVRLISSTNTGCKDTMIFNSITTNKPLARFNSSNPTNCSPTLVSFSDTSVNATSWLWDFGDGSSSVNQDPAHIYDIPGLYTIKLIVENSLGCTDTMIRSNYIKVPGTIAKFNTLTKQFCTHSGIQFIDSSINASSWSWNFGDGNTSSIQHPSNTYQNPGQYTVSLIVQDAFGCSSNFTLTNPVNVNPLPVSNFTVSDSLFCSPFSVSFNNTSQNAITYLWNFGDGDTSTLEKPVHHYLNIGNDTVSLIATNAFGCSDTSTYNSIVAKPMLVADFTANITSGCSKSVVVFSDSSNLISTATYFWDFGNGSTSTLKNPSTTFVNPGSHSVSLVLKNNIGCSDTVVKSSFITIQDLIPPAKSNILCATVTSDNSTYLIWEQSTASDFSYYEIYRKDILTGAYGPVGRINTISMVGFSDTLLNTLSNSYCYKVLTFDKCGYALPLDSIQEHCTINATAHGINNNIHVKWTPYIGASVKSYSVYRMEAGSNISVIVATVPSDTLSILDTTVYCPRDFSYRIKANNLNNNSIGSNSDTTIARPTYNILSQQKVEIVRSTVINNSEILTEWNTPSIAPSAVTGYSIHRSLDNINFSFLTTVTPSVHEFIDRDVDVNAQNYFYKIEVGNICNVPNSQSNQTSSILLKAEVVDGSIQLNWTKYEGWDMGVEYYIIEKMNERGEWEMIQKVDGNQLNFQIGQ